MSTVTKTRTDFESNSIPSGKGLDRTPARTFGEAADQGSAIGAQGGSRGAPDPAAADTLKRKLDLAHKATEQIKNIEGTDSSSTTLAAAAQNTDPKFDAGSNVKPSAPPMSCCNVHKEFQLDCPNARIGGWDDSEEAPDDSTFLHRIKEGESDPAVIRQRKAMEAMRVATEAEYAAANRHCQQQELLDESKQDLIEKRRQTTFARENLNASMTADGKNATRSGVEADNATLSNSHHAIGGHLMPHLPILGGGARTTSSTAPTGRGATIRMRDRRYSNFDSQNIFYATGSSLIPKGRGRPGTTGALKNRRHSGRDPFTYKPGESWRNDADNTSTPNNKAETRERSPIRGTDPNQHHNRGHEASGGRRGTKPPDNTAKNKATGGHPPPNGPNHFNDDDAMRDEPPHVPNDGDDGPGGGDSSDPDDSDGSEDEDSFPPHRGASRKRRPPMNQREKTSKRHKYEGNSEKNIPNSLCELPKLETAKDYDFLVWKEKSYHSIWGK